MNTAIAIFAGATAFLAGFFVGVNPPPAMRNKRKGSTDIERMMSAVSEEYRNFLNYDGSIQN
ncbi:MAG: hypothetical protein II372_04590 [Clostridia bacterium]|jgi:hypothetical protein|nr:hypothetical protein [Clostridia bacterium]MEE0808533.1 hypothetical protein [Acutalibacteraceae bacterium]